MELATVHLNTSIHNELIKRDVTPAEALLLAKLHGPAMNGGALGRIIVTGEESRDSLEERTRLGLKYTGTIGQGKDVKPALQAVFPDDTRELPETFEEIIKHLGIKADLTSTEEVKAVEEALAKAKAKTAEKKTKKGKADVEA